MVSEASAHLSTTAEALLSERRQPVVEHLREGTGLWAQL